MSSAGLSDRLLAPEIVGRDRELARLRALLDAGGRAGAVVQVVAETGLGKTRLVSALADEARAAGRLVIEGRATPLDAALPFGVLQDALRADRAARPGAKALAEPLAAGFPARLLPEVGEPLAAGDGDRGVLFEAAARWARAVAGSAGLVLVLEDLHWADASSLALVAHLARATRGDRVSLVLTYRPDEQEPGSPLDELRRELARARLGREIELEPLGAEAVAAMLEAILGLRPEPDALAAVTRLSGGNPFVVEELVRDAAESGRLDLAEGRWRIDDPTQLPWTLRDMLRDRLGRLGESDRELLRWAAVLGERFDLALLAAVAGASDEPLLSALSRLRAAGLIVDDPAEAPGRRMAFRHALTRIAVVGELVAADRRRRHEVALTAAESGAAELLLEELLAHALGAGDRGRGFAHSLAAARLSRRLCGHDEAERHYERALELWEPALGAEERAAALLEWGHLATEVHYHPRALELLRDAREAYESMGDAVGATAARVSAAWAVWRRGDRAATDELRRALAELPPDAPNAARRLPLMMLARMLVEAGELEEGTAHAREAIALLPAEPSPGHVAERARMLNAIGLAALMRGGLRDGQQTLIETARLADASDDPLVDVRAYGNIAALGRCDSAEPLARAADWAERGLAIAQDRGLRAYEAWLALVRAAIHLRAGETDPVEPLLARAESVLADGAPEAHERLGIEVRRAERDLVLGRLTQARDSFRSVLALADDHGHIQYVMDVRQGLAEALLALGDPAGARAALRPAVAALDARRDQLPVLGSVVVTGVEAATALGDAAEADALAVLLERGSPGPRARYARTLADLAGGRPPAPGAVAAAASEVAASDRRWESARMRLTAAELLAEHPERVDEAAALALAALPEFKGMGADPWARRSERLLRRLGRRVPSRSSGAGRDGLTARELEVLGLAAELMSNREIAERLFISEATAASHLAHVFAKLGVTSRAAAVRTAVERGLLTARTGR